MRTGLFDCVAHPDLFLHTYPRFDADCRAVSRDLCQAAATLGLPLEFNLLGLSRFDQERGIGWQSYPCPEFWQIAAECGCTAIIGYDAHNPDSLRRQDLFDRARRSLDELGIRRISRLPGIG